jgi:DNA repair photolyase
MKKIHNPPNPYESTHRELLEPPGEARLEVYEDSSRTILSHNESPDIGFRWSVNPYRGCFHACAYCYARRSHEYLGFGAGTDFESKIVIKKEAAALLRQEFLKRSWKGDPVVFSGVTDCYQPVEAVYRLTRGCLDVCAAFRNPAYLITKSFLVTRDIDVFVELDRTAAFCATVSIPFATDEMARKIEPQAATVERRFAAVEAMAKAGLTVGVSLAPTIPGLNENDIPIVMKRAKDVGAKFAFHSMVRLAGSVQDVFVEKIQTALPKERAERVLSRIRDSRGGRLNDTRFGHRMAGRGTYWKSIEDLFRLSQKKYGLTQFPEPPDPSPFQRPSAQMELEIKL